MRLLTERCFYTTLIIVLTIIAIIVPIIVIQMGKKSLPFVYVYESPPNESRSKDGSKKTVPSLPDKYYNLYELSAYLEDFVKRRSILFTMDTIDTIKTYGHHIYEVVLGKKGDPKPMVVIVSGILGKDWGSVLASIRIMDKFYLDVKGTTEMLEKFNFHFIPVLNPDGYKFSMTLPIHSNWVGNNPSSYSDEKPSGHSILYSFGEKSEETEETKAFKTYFNSNKHKIKAICFLFSPRNSTNRWKNGFEIPKIYKKEKNMLLEELTLVLKEERQTPFEYTENLDDPTEDRIDRWVIRTTRPDPILVINFVTNFGVRAKELIPRITKIFGDEIHFILTRVLTVLYAKYGESL